MLDAGFVSLGAFAAGSLALAVVAFSRPVTDATTTADAYRHISALRYEARTPRSAAYPSGRVEPGQPIFTRLIDQVDVEYSYRIDSAYNVEAGGAASLTATVGDANGWQKSIELVPPTSFLDPRPAGARPCGTARLGGCPSRLPAGDRPSPPPASTAAASSEHDRIVDRHGYAIVPVATSEQAEGRCVVDLPSIQDLLRLAENHGAPVLHETEAGECFWFELGRTTFRYAPEPSPEAPLSEPKPGQAALAPKASMVTGTR
jgi:hypothetical protein